MTTMQGSVAPGGALKTHVIRAQKAPLSWRLKNTLRWGFIWGWVTRQMAFAFTALTGVPTMVSCLRAKLIRADGQVIDYGVLGYRVVTTAFVNHLVDELQAASEFADYDFHDSGEGSTGELVGDTDMETTDGEARATGTPGEGATANIYQNVGTITYSGTKAIVEHGLFCNSTGATLMDRTVFSTINVSASDSIQFTYEITFTAGS